MIPIQNINSSPPKPQIRTQLIETRPPLTTAVETVSPAYIKHSDDSSLFAFDDRWTEHDMASHLAVSWTLEQRNNERTQTEEDSHDPLPSIKSPPTRAYDEANKSG